MSYTIDIRHLKIAYGRRLAVNDLSLTISEGESVALIGPNGAGKSSLLAAISGQIEPQSGSIVVGDVTPQAHPVKIKKAVGFSEQPPILYEFLTVLEHLTLVGEIRGQHDDEQCIDLLNTLGIFDLRNRMARELSFGMRQRLGLALSLIGDTKILLLDETLNGLDPKAFRYARDTLGNQVRQGKTLLLSTHILTGVERLCQRLIVMNEGNIVADISEEDLSKIVEQGPYAIEDWYLEQV